MKLSPAAEAAWIVAAGEAGGVGRRHGIRLFVTLEAVRFAAEEAARSGPGAREARRTVERLVEAPLSALVLSGKLSRHPAWLVVYDEGGVYLLPDEGPPS